MADNLQSFIAGMVAKSGGYDRPNRFAIEITPPSGLRVSSADLLRIETNCEAAPIPGHNMETVNINQGGESLSSRIVDMLKNDPILLFKLSADHLEKDFWEGWLRMTISRKGNNVNYYDNYVGSVKVHKLGLKNQIVKTYNMIEVVPVQIQDIDLSHTATNAISYVAVVLKIYDWNYDE